MADAIPIYKKQGIKYDVITDQLALSALFQK